MSNPKIALRDLHLYYGDFHALKGLSMEIPEKEITAFIGPSGCGKSTCLKTLNRMNDLVEGCKITGGVFIDGEDIYAPQTDVTLLRRRAGMVFQKPNPFPMSVYDNIAYGPRVHGVKKKHELDEIVERSLREAALWDEVKDRLKKSALGLSGGQHQRLCIARALAVEPDILLMDEPTSALDPMTTQAILRLLQKINREMGITIVVITHEMAVIRQICTHVAILDGGVIAEEGSVDDVFTHTRSEAGKRLFGIVASENHEQVQEKPAIRIVFNGETIAEPIVADLILHLGVPLSIRSADVHTLNGAQYGQLLISRPDDPMVCHRAIEYLKERGLTVEEVRA